MRLSFCVPEGGTRDIVFSRLPLGLDFRKGSPFTIDKVQHGSHAEEMGVQPDWVVISCNDHNLREKTVRDGLQILYAACTALPQLRSAIESSQPFRESLLDVVERAALKRAASHCEEEMEVISSLPCDLVYQCKHNAGLFNCLLMYLRFAECAEKKGFKTMFFDGTALPLYGNICALFPALPSRISDQSRQASKEFCGSGSFANCRGVYERKGGLNIDDATQGRALAARHLSLAPEVEHCLLEAARKFELSDAIGVHIRRTDKGREAPSNLSITAKEVALAVVDNSRRLGTTRAFVASDDTQFSKELHDLLEAEDVSVISWGSHMPERAGKPCHYDHKIPGLEKAADAIADCFLLAKCRALISTYSSLSVIATLWSAPDTPWMHFHDCSVHT